MRVVSEHLHYRIVDVSLTSSLSALYSLMVMRVGVQSGLEVSIRQGLTLSLSSKQVSTIKELCYRWYRKSCAQAFIPRPRRRLVRS
jgi:oligoribonuclease (3'-5' exoribonuclease)